jgi:hypothetical protein
MNSINLYQGAKILAAGLGTSFVTNHIGNKLANHLKPYTGSYTNTIIKTVSAVAGLAAAALTAHYLGVVSFKNFSFQSKAQDAAVATLPQTSSIPTPNDNTLKEFASHYTSESHAENPDYLKQMGGCDKFIAEMAKRFLDKKDKAN